MLTPEPCEIPSDTAIETIEPSVQPAPERSFEPLPPKPWDPMGMKGVDSQHVPSDTDDHLSVFTDAAGSVVLGEDIKYWSNSTTSTESSHNAANPHDFAVELEGDCVFPSLTPNFLQMAMTQLAFARGTVEPEVRYLERIKRILQKMTLDEFELLVEDVDRDWVPKESLWREFAQFQLRAGIVIGKREIAATMLDRLKLEQGFHKEASGNPVYGILADILEETPCLGSKLDKLFSLIYLLIVMVQRALLLHLHGFTQARTQVTTPAKTLMTPLRWRSLKPGGQLSRHWLNVPRPENT